MNQPNILIFTTDQQLDKSIYSFSESITPNIDQFCHEGITFTNAHTVSPHCVYNGFDYDELYDLKNDPYEMTNLIDDPSHSNELQLLAKSLWSFAKETNDVCINPYILVSLAPFGPGIINE